MEVWKELIPPISLIASLATLSLLFLPSFVASSASYLLLLSGVRHSLFGQQIVTIFPDRGLVIIVVDWRCSGAVSVLAYGSLFVFTIFPLRGDELLKWVWLVGLCAYFLLWNVLRVWMATWAGFLYGSSFFWALHALAFPFLELCLFVTMWALAARSVSHVA